ncbi:MAG: NahK/ErcS family hybrid sensor histidine kinase/response regulator, partial [Wenzhouxiangellaceae bacterium]
EHHRGMVLAVAFESLVKLVAFAVVGLWALYALLGGPGGMAETIAGNDRYQEMFGARSLPAQFWTQMLLGAAAILCLPRQFQVAFVENERTGDLATARWLFPLYLLLFTLLVVPIAIAGLERFPAGDVHADTFLLTLPMSGDQAAMTMLSFLGGFSAATGMVIVATVALATMVSNDLIAPILIRAGIQRGQGFARVLLLSRRLTILLLALVAWLYYLRLQGSEALAAIGLVSFAAVIHFAPALVLGVYSKRISREGAMAGLIIGLTGWLLLVFIPSLGVPWPEALSPGVHAATRVSLALNVLALLGVSFWVRRRRPTLPMLLGQRESRSPVTVGELKRLATSFIGAERVELAFAGALPGHARHEGGSMDRLPANVELVGFTERLLAGCIGSASARSVLTAGLRQSGLSTDQALALLEQTSSAIRFNRDLLEATLDHISQGVSVVDADLRLVSWNRAYAELFRYPPGLLYPGRPVQELIRFNLERESDSDSEQIETAVDRRMHHMRRGTPYAYERRHGDDRVIEIRGNPMPGGGYVTTYSDITGFKQTEAELKSAYATMEQKVAERTRELRATMSALELARHDAEQANRTKTRFLATASHDLLQPMNAARLFSANLVQRTGRLDSEDARLVRRVDHSLAVAEEMLSALLDISRLDQGVLKPNWSDIRISTLLDKVERQFNELARRRGLSFRVRPCPATVHTDPKMLQRIVFNLVNNALRYTTSGGVLVGCRRRGERLRIEVRDTGPGIAPEARERIFEEFERLEETPDSEEFSQGLGLGLSICRRISRMLDARLALTSEPGRGSVFSVSVPLAEQAEPEPTAKSAMYESAAPSLAGLRVLCIDDDREILDGMVMLLERWGCRVRTATNADQALAGQVSADHEPDIILADYHLGDQIDGIELCVRIRERAGSEIPVIMLTADRSDELVERSTAQGFVRLYKPIKPAALRALMQHLLGRR